MGSSCRASSTPTRETRRWDTHSGHSVNGFARPTSWPSDITEALNEFYSHFDSLQVKYEQRFVDGLTLLNSFAWEHSLDNASASLEGNTPSPQDGNNIRADYAQSDYNLPIANITSLVYELPVGHGRQFLASANGVSDALLGGWQVSVINTAQAGTPFNLTYSPNSSPGAVAADLGNLPRRQRVPAGYRAWPAHYQRRQVRAANGTGYVNYINLNAFRDPPIKDAANNYLSPFGNATRNPGRTPAFNESDLALEKKFTTPVEGLNVEFRTEFFNIFNHTNYYLPSGVSIAQGTTTATVGIGGSVPVSAVTEPTSVVNGTTNTGQISTTFEPRVIQFGLKIIY